MWIDPVAFTLPALSLGALEIGPFPIRWYALAYLAGFLLGWRWCVWLIRRRGEGRPSAADFEAALSWLILGVILGGRLGYVLFYDPGHYLHQPADILRVWQGGMSFHGGLIGAAAAIFGFSWRHGIEPLRLGDLVACAAPIGLFFGRLANFINAELWGRPSDLPWAMVFPGAGPVPRHPSQLYEAGLEGLALFALMSWLMLGTGLPRRAGALSGVFLLAYGLARFAVEFTRQPDAQLGFLAFGMTMGQILSLPMIALGVALIHRARRQSPRPSGAAAGQP